MTILWKAVTYKRWDIVLLILKHFPHIDINAAAPLKIEGKRLTLLWAASSEKQWDIVEFILRNYPSCSINETPSPGRTVVWLAAAFKKWELVSYIVKMYPNVDLDAAPSNGTPVSWYVAFAEKWELFECILKHHPKINLDAAPSEGTYQGMSVFWILAYKERWDTLESILESDQCLNVNAAPLNGPFSGQSALVLAADQKQWKLVWLMIKNHPDIFLGNAELTDGPTLIDLMCQNEENEYCRAALGFLIFKSIVFPEEANFVQHANEESKAFITKKRAALMLICIRAFKAFGDTWNFTSHEFLKKMPEELLFKLFCHALESKIPGFRDFPPKLVGAYWNTMTVKLHKTRKAKALSNIAHLAFRQFRHSNGLIFKEYKKSQINDAIHMIEEALHPFPDHLFKMPLRKKLIEEIGRKQTKPAEFDRELIVDAAQRTLRDFESQGAEALREAGG